MHESIRTINYIKYIFYIVDYVLLVVENRMKQDLDIGVDLGR
jgi:hypothetical protein